MDSLEAVEGTFDQEHVISEDSGLTVQMRRLIWVFAGRTSLVVALFSAGSNYTRQGSNQQPPDHHSVMHSIKPLKSAVDKRCYQVNSFLTST